jgi:hypothetical protein
MKKFLIFILIAVAGFYLWQKHFAVEPPRLEPLYGGYYVVVYGRESCSWTKKYMDDLRAEDIRFVFKSVDDQNNADELHQRMKVAGLDTSHYLLPVIDVNAHIFIRPEMEKIIAAYNEQ